MRGAGGIGGENGSTGSGVGGDGGNGGTPGTGGAAGTKSGASNCILVPAHPESNDGAAGGAGVKGEKGIHGESSSPVSGGGGHGAGGGAGGKGGNGGRGGDGEAELERADLAPAQRLLAIFGPFEGESPALIRGCPFHNAVVEGAGELPEVARLVQSHKQTFRDRLVAIAAETGAADPENLGRQLAVLFEGANALAASCNDPQAFADARQAAETLLDTALNTAAER